MSDRFFWSLMTVLIAGFIVYVGFASIRRPATPEQPIVSTTAIHWHPEIAVYIKGEKQLITPNIRGLVHTHDSSGTLHWELDGPVRKNFVLLKFFFGTWGKTFNTTQIFDKKNGPDGKVKMTVNGQTNTQFENYQVKDKDKIEIMYE